MITRRDTIAGGIALAGLPIIGNTSPIKSMLGSCHNENDSIAVQNPYITDGLIAMWDGEWNAGLGVHDANATEWKDFIGGKVFPLGSATVFDKHIHFDVANKTRRISISDIDVVFAEAVFSINGPIQAYNFGIGIMKNNAQCSAGFRDTAKHITWAHARLKNIIPEYNTVYVMSGTLGSTSGAYLNGVYVSSDRNSQWSGYIANDYFSLFSNSGWNSYGDCYNLRLYSRVLGAAEVAYNYSIDKERFGLS